MTIAHASINEKAASEAGAVARLGCCGGAGLGCCRWHESCVRARIIMLFELIILPIIVMIEGAGSKI